MNTLNAFSPNICFQEVPNHTSLAFTIAGCPLRCDGCHSEYSWEKHAGLPLSPAVFLEYLTKYQNFITCVLFFGGEWNKEKLIPLLKITKERGLKTCLYSGKTKLHHELLQHLDFVKLGPWKPLLGRLDQVSTNQRFIDTVTGNLLNHLFLEQN
jgi:anaerobic ribonucleoside-triphosphate reductase activating protein